jgi:hypothetical protein
MLPDASVQTPPTVPPPAVRRWVMLTLVLLMLWFSGPAQGAGGWDETGRRRRVDPRAHARSPGGWVSGLPAPARARRSTRPAQERIAARRRPGRRG